MASLSSFPKLCPAVDHNPFVRCLRSKQEGGRCCTVTSWLFRAGGHISTAIIVLTRFGSSHQNEPETRIRVHGVSLGMTPGNTSREGHRATGEGRELEQVRLGLCQLRGSVGHTSESPPLGQEAGYLSTDPHPPSIEGLFLGVAVAASTCGPSRSWCSLLLGGERQDTSLHLLLCYCCRHPP